MATDINLSISPYLDDFDESKKYVRILQKPGFAVQTREMNQRDSMVQKQIERLGNNILKRGTITDGVNFNFYNNYPYIKINDTSIDGAASVPSSYVGYFARNSSNLIAHVINYADGFESTDPDLKTLYVKYINSGTSFEDTAFSAGEILTIYDEDNSIHSIDIVAGGIGYSNSDVLVFTPILLANVTDGSIAVGDTITDPISNASGIIVSIDDSSERTARNMLPGTVLVNSHSNVIGTSTSFTTNFVNGDFVAIYSNSSSYEIKKINVVSNATFMNLTSNVSFANVTSFYANTTEITQYVKYRPISADLSNNVISSDAWTFNTGNVIQGNTSGDVFTILDIIGENASAGVTTDSSGKIISVNITSRGSNYPRIPYISVKSSTGSSANLVPKNYLAQITVSNLSGSVGNGYAFGVTSGTIYQKGYLLQTDAQTIVVEKYSTKPNNITVGFNVEESIITSYIDPSLRDNSNGDAAEAEGADRLKMNPVLITMDSANAASNAEFFTLVEWSEGFPYKQNSRTFYNQIGDEMALRTVESQGNFVTDRFMVTSQSVSNTELVANTYSVIIDPGIAYIDGYRISTITNFAKDTPKSIDTSIVNNAKVSLNYENYIRISNMGGMFEFDRANVIDLHDTVKNYLSNTSLYSAGNLNAAGNKIGEARIRNLVLEQGVPGTPTAIYRLYVFDIRMNSGKSFKDVKSVFQNGSNFDGVADIELEINSTNEQSEAKVYGNNNKLVFSSGFESPLNSNGISYVYRTISDSNEIANTGIISVSITGDPNKTFPYTGVLTDSQKAEIYVAPTANLIAQASLTGTVNVSSTSANVTGTGTAFLTELKPGQYININGGTSNNIIRRITAIVNNTVLIAESNSSFTGTGIAPKKAWPAYVPIELSYNTNIVANTTSSDTVLNINLGSTLATASNTDIIIGYNVRYDDATPTAKIPNRNKLVKLALSNNVNGTSGPWCLGVPDIFRLRNVYSGNSSVNSSSTNVTSEFFIDNNQNANYLNHSYLYKKNGSSILSDDNYLLVEFDSFTSNAGFYNTTSYVSGNKATRFTEDSKPLANLSSTINTLEIPEFFSDDGTYYDLISVIDFRPSVDRTANLTSTMADVTINPANTVSFASSDRYFPLPDSILVHDVEYFKSRIDSVILNKSGTFSIINGIPGQAIAPKTPSGSMKLNDLYIPSYPSLPERVSINEIDIMNTLVYSNKYKSTRVFSSEISSLFSTTDYNREQPLRKTAVDVGKLERRVNDLEYYVALNSVQQGIKDRVIPSSISPNIDRFKYGFFVDDYEDDNYSEIDSPEYNASIIDGYVLPSITAFNALHEGANTSSAFTHYKLVSQDNATVDDNNTPDTTDKTKYVGTMTVAPGTFKVSGQKVYSSEIRAPKKGTMTYGVKQNEVLGGVDNTLIKSLQRNSSGKIICTAMNNKYGFGSFRQSIWLDHSKNLDPAYEVGYHKIFLPIVNWSYGSEDSNLKKFTRNILERVARKRTSDIWKNRKGKMDLEGRIYRTILEPMCFIVGKIVGVSK